MRPAVAPRLFMPDRDKRMTLIFRLEPVIKNLPYDFDIMRAEACSEGYRFVEQLATAWEAGVRSPSYSNFRQKEFRACYGRQQTAAGLQPYRSPGRPVPPAGNCQMLHRYAGPKRECRARSVRVRSSHIPRQNCPR